MHCHSHSATSPVTTSAPALFTHTSFPGLCRPSVSQTSRVPEVRLEGPTVAAGSGDPLGDARRPLPIAVRHEHRRARAAQRWRNGGADAAARARDHGPRPGPSLRPPGLLATWSDISAIRCRKCQSSRRRAEARPPPAAPWSPRRDRPRRAAGLRAGGEREKPGNITPSHRLRGAPPTRTCFAARCARSRARPRGPGGRRDGACRGARLAPRPTPSSHRAADRRPAARARGADKGEPLRERLGEVLHALTINNARAMPMRRSAWRAPAASTSPSSTTCATSPG